MLSEAEQRRLTEIERSLKADDPGFVQRFNPPEQPRPRQWRGIAALLVFVVAVAVAVTGLLLSSVGTVVVAQTAAGAGAGMWATDRRSR
jgi:hypothetical protein